jgi:hypothetical protein
LLEERGKLLHQDMGRIQVDVDRRSKATMEH